MDFDTPISNLSEARQYFQAMGCSSFHMAREFPDRYDEYGALGISEATERQWAAEEVELYLSRLENKDDGNEQLWNTHSRLVDLVSDWRFGEHLDRVLDVTKAIGAKLTQRDKLLVSETIVGRREDRSGLIFRGFAAGRPATANGFVDTVWQFVSVPFFNAPDLEERRERLLERLAEAKKQ